MIKKVGNWVFGSFFRTMGRFFFFLFFGFLLATILSKSEIKITDLLGIEMVKADTVIPTWNNMIYQNGNQMPSSNDFRYFYETIQSRSGNEQRIMTFSNNQLPNINGVYPYKVQLKVYSDSIFNTYYTNNYTEDTQYINENGNAFNIGIVYNNSNNQNIGGGLCSAQEENNVGNLKYYTVICNIVPGAVTINQMNFKYWWYDSDYPASNYIEYGIYPSFDWIFSDGSVISGNINNQTQQQEQQHNETMNFFNNENTTQAESDASNFFDNFTSQDNGGISSIITAPLQAISGLVSATCTPITLPLPYLDNKTIVLPCMSAIYQEHFGAFFTIYQTIIFGALAYRMLVSIFMMIQGFKNPDDDKIEVVDL